jgi:hypothetical protein
MKNIDTGEVRAVKSGDQILYDPKNHNLVMLDRAGSILTFNIEGKAREQKLYTQQFFRHQSEFIIFCSILAAINELTLDPVMDRIQIESDCEYWAYTLY